MTPETILLWIYTIGIGGYFFLFYLKNKYEVKKGRNHVTIETGIDHMPMPPNIRAITHIITSLLWPILLLSVVFMIASDLIFGTKYVIKEMSFKTKKENSKEEDHQ